MGPWDRVLAARSGRRWQWPQRLWAVRALASCAFACMLLLCCAQGLHLTWAPAVLLGLPHRGGRHHFFCTPPMRVCLVMMAFHSESFLLPPTELLDPCSCFEVAQGALDRQTVPTPH